MIEMSTGVVFLLSSMYGTGSTAQATAANIASNANPKVDTAIVSVTDRKEVIDYLKKEYADTPILIAIAKCESNFTQFNEDGEVIRGKANRADVGVMQINEKYHLSKAKSLSYDIYTVKGNVDYAKYLYENQGADPWKASSKCWGSARDLTVNKN